MFKSILILLTFFLFGTDSFYAQGRETWYGEYFFSEEPVKADAGYSMVMEWKLVVYPGEGNAMEMGVLEINGQQTELKFNVYIQGDSGNFMVFFSEAISETDPGFKKGDILFSLKKTSEGMVTTWGTMASRLAEKYQRECQDCFEEVK